MNSENLKLAFIGGALDSAVGTTHKIAAQMDNRWQLCCGCFSTENGTNVHTGDQWGIKKERIYDNWQELLVNEKEKIDATLSLECLPPVSHPLSFETSR